MKTSRQQDELIDYFESSYINDSGFPIDLWGRPYLIDIYTKRYPSIVLACSRQAGKSTYIGININYEAHLRKNNSLLYTSLTEKHVDEFRRSKLLPLFSSTLGSKSEMSSSIVLNNKNMIELSNGSHIGLRAIGDSPDSTLGITARKIYFDEVQSLYSGNIAVALECSASFGNDSEYVYCGTPNSFLDPLWERYEKSSKHEWLVTCLKCHTEMAPLGMQNIDKNKPYLFCLECGKEVNPINGRWQSTNPESTLPGYRINRLMIPNTPWRNPQGSGILDRYEEYTPHEFNNYVLALPSETGEFALSREEVLACCEDYDFLDINNPKTWHFGDHLCMSIDWADNQEEGGSSFTCFALGDYYGDRIWLRYVKRFDDPRLSPDDIIKEICLYASKLHVRIVVADHGWGHKENMRLREILNIQVTEFKYTGETETGKWNKQLYRYLLGRTHSLDSTIHKIQQRGFAFPRHDVLKPFIADLLTTKRVVDSERINARYLKPASAPDDFLHVLNYLNSVFRRIYHFYI